MTSRAFCIPGVLFLLAATVLLIITSVSLPFLPDIDFVRSHVDSGSIGVANAQGSVTSSSISQLRVSRSDTRRVRMAPNWCLHSLDCGPIVPSKHLLGIAIVAPPDMLTASAFRPITRTIQSLSSPVGLGAWQFTQSVRNQKFIHGPSAGL